MKGHEAMQHGQRGQKERRGEQNEERSGRAQSGAGYTGFLRRQSDRRRQADPARDRERGGQQGSTNAPPTGDASHALSGQTGGVAYGGGESPNAVSDSGRYQESYGPHGGAQEDMGSEKIGRGGGYGGLARQGMGHDPRYGRPAQDEHVDAAGYSYRGGESAGSQPAVPPGESRDRFDADYQQWRAEQINRLDQDYDAWKNRRHERFSGDFDRWRRAREAEHAAAIRRGGSGGTLSVGSAAAADSPGSVRGNADNSASATPGTPTSAGRESSGHGELE
ncbi:hypothetical protein [Propionivibrio soli]|uniref:hypothetical protein n=1 Tax=Propionivibrio soli TaxID=2976531 RepID=UPI0021E981DC|nr:hypothetical protein [Propionivibrio soli]